MELLVGAKGNLQESINLMKHRVPDANGVWVSKDNTVGLEHARLKIIDLSEQANQPMISTSRRYLIVFNG